MTLNTRLTDSEDDEGSSPLRGMTPDMVSDMSGLSTVPLCLEFDTVPLDEPPLRGELTLPSEEPLGLCEDPAVPCDESASPCCEYSTVP